MLSHCNNLSFKNIKHIIITYLSLKLFMIKVGGSLGGLSLAEMFDLQPIQSLLIKFWFLGLSSECLIAPQDNNTFKFIRKGVNFANCFTFQMPIKTYINFMQKIEYSLAELQPKRTFQILLSHLRNNKIISVSFQLFGVSFLQLFGRIVEMISIDLMTNLLRKVYIGLTVIHKNGTSIIKVSNKSIQPLNFEQLIPNFQEITHRLAEEDSLQRPKQQYSLHMDDNPEIDVNTIKGRLQSQRNHNMSHRGSSGGNHYPIGEKMKKRDKANLSCFVMGGFEIVDYSDSINQLHKKLLTKILLNK